MKDDTKKARHYTKCWPVYFAYPVRVLKLKKPDKIGCCLVILCAEHNTCDDCKHYYWE